VTKIPLMIPNLHTAQCRYSNYSVTWLQLHCHEGQKIRNFNSVFRCAAKTGYGEQSQENLTKSKCYFHWRRWYRGGMFKKFWWECL